MAVPTARIQLAEAIKAIDDCPEPVKQMFITSLPNAFGPDPHPYQKEVASMIRNASETARNTAQEAQGAMSQSVNEARTALEACQANEASMKDAQNTTRVVLEEKVAALETRKVAVLNEETLCKELKALEAEVMAEKQKLEEGKGELESIMNGSFQMLLDGGWEDEELRDGCIEAVCNYLGEQGGDTVLLAALPKALALPPAMRGPFDAIAVEAASSAFAEKVSALAAQIAENEERFEDAKAEYLGAWAISDVAMDEEKLASDERDEADAAHEMVIVEKKLAISKVQDQDAALANVLSQATLLESKIQQLDAAIAALSQLESGEADKEILQSAMEVDKENSVNIPVADQDVKESPMAVDQLPLAVAA
jgi:hypothetical protein